MKYFRTLLDKVPIEKLNLPREDEYNIKSNETVLKIQ